ncbi:hypothetical protein ACE1YR_10525 [Pseudomonas sp. K1(2024)]|uniref:Uncharacterized protein n=2 Tax=Pseudomonas TaxID=286 RepID=A0AAI8P9Q4_9PSED|nr:MULTISPECIES: hypothetical protein [Pseudomonas]AIZ32604.1 hypothetical protein NJ69_06090 [Pseudomonas parafulva]AXO88108.1 hypothetical protein DZC75_08910 [Pseudomonas parafulva]MDO7902528.1 hypothetical protein [Pseudomonas sp. K13]MDV9032607.1 hypothetical protein [Pseudomonas sp. RAC1]
MRVRDETYWKWADSQLHSRCHDEELSDGTSIDVQVRLSRLGATQLFLGVYAQGGKALCEEYHRSLPGQTMTRALVWGVDRARALATGALVTPPLARRQA